MNVTSPEFLEDPYRFYRSRREEGGIRQMSEFTWTVTGYEVMSQLLSKSAAGRGNIGQIPQPQGDTCQLDQIKQRNPVLGVLEKWMLFKNPPEHAKTRGAVKTVFTVNMIAQLEPLMRSTIRELIAQIKASSTNTVFDLVSSISYPFPITVICEMLGIPPQDRNQFRRWTQGLAVAVENDFQAIPKHLRDQANESAIELEAYFKQLLPLKKQQNNDDLISKLVAVGNDGLTDYEVLSNCVFLLFAGQDTTTSIISNSINAFLQNPEQLDLLRTRPDLIENAVDECLRFDPPVQMVGRFALADIHFEDIHIKRGDHIYAFLGAAGRDPAVNSDPDTFNIARNNIKHLAFARGAHHCLGASLAKLELKVVLEELLHGFQDLAFAGVPTRRKTWLMRGFDTLPVVYAAQ